MGKSTLIILFFTAFLFGCVVNAQLNKTGHTQNTHSSDESGLACPIKSGVRVEGKIYFLETIDLYVAGCEFPTGILYKYKSQELSDQVFQKLDLNMGQAHIQKIDIEFTGSIDEEGTVIIEEIFYLKAVEILK